MNNLYLLSQDVNTGYDTYDSMVVCAESQEEALRIHPNSEVRDEEWVNDYWVCTWAKPHEIKVELIGTAHELTPKGVVCASFNAG